MRPVVKSRGYEAEADREERIRAEECKAEFARRHAASCQWCGDGTCDKGHVDDSDEMGGEIVGCVVLVFVALALAFAGLAIWEAFR